MKIDMSGVIYSMTYALDCIEAELIGVPENHAKWVAYLSTIIGKRLGYSKNELSDLSACAALHDNALTQYLDDERKRKGLTSLGTHCIIGEENLRCFPFYGDTKDFILYHHENADGTGPFGKRLAEIPFKAHIIHLADILDATCHVYNISSDNYDKMVHFLNQQRDLMFDGKLIDIFLHGITKDFYLSLKGQNIDKLLNDELPHYVEEYPFDQVRAVIDVFGRIVDYKSPFTHSHSEQIAHKMYKMAEFYGYPIEIQERMYVAGALHDIGKMAITNDILEKPDKLSDTEFIHMKNHAMYTYLILKQISGFEDITEWASLHHEKLNGKGYPFGKTAEELSHQDRILACVDIYQALSEDRPYKKGVSHHKCIEIMNDMASNGFIDKKITADIDKVFCAV